MAIRILQLTDPHLMADPAATLKGVPTRDALLDVLTFIRSQEIDFDRLVLTGDLTHDGEEASYADLRELLGEWVDRSYVIPGNHDSRKALRNVFGDRIDSPRGSIAFACDVNDWRLIGLDSLVDGCEWGQIDADQLMWLDEQLAAHANRPTVLFVHHPPIPVGSPWLDRIGLADADGLIELIATAPQVKAICCGHVHHDFEGRVGQAKVFASPSTCIQFEPAGDSSSYALLPPGFRILHLDGHSLRSDVWRLDELKYPPTR